MDPGVHNAGAVDAQKNTQAGCVGGVVDVQEGVNARLRVSLRHIGNAVNHAAGAARCGDFARVEHVEREGVVRLVAGAVADRSALRDAQKVLRLLVRCGLEAD